MLESRGPKAACAIHQRLRASGAFARNWARRSPPGLAWRAARTAFAFYLALAEVGHGSLNAACRLIVGRHHVVLNQVRGQFAVCASEVMNDRSQASLSIGV